MVMERLEALNISIRALLAEGDSSLRPVSREQVEFQSAPSLRRATVCVLSANPKILFQSAPSLRRATCLVAVRVCDIPISIRALLAEGDR